MAVKRGSRRRALAAAATTFFGAYKPRERPSIDHEGADFIVDLPDVEPPIQAQV
jgi:hypothetical protein